ncbi:ABC transporter permease [Aureibaculum luteum]|uniref:ABC transporter permease n=1 Tax=Aureibaculum luteum TaxID=1548456 RepID=UPI001E4393BE|nr:ABC transporter permease [Aureibaculum luteum]
MTNRKLDAFGLYPLLAYILLIIAFFGLSNYLFSKSEYAPYLYIVVALGLSIKLSEKKRIDFLKMCFKTTDYFKIRIVENSLIALPFVIYLIVEERFLPAVVLFLFVNLFAFFNLKTTTNFTIPTPFGKRPFEFSSGFRNTFFVFPIAYIITYISVNVNNFNLGVFSMLLIFIVTLSYYAKLENEYYVWSFSDSSKVFLIKKIRTALLFSTFLSLPIVIFLILFFHSELETLLIFWILGYAYLVTVILAKYSIYPYEINIPQGVLIAVSLVFPPLLIGIIPYFYSQSVKRLKTILE